MSKEEKTLVVGIVYYHTFFCVVVKVYKSGSACCPLIRLFTYSMT